MELDLFDDSVMDWGNSQGLSKAKKETPWERDLISTWRGEARYMRRKWEMFCIDLSRLQNSGI